MGMRAYFVSIDVKELEEIIANPKMTEDILFPSEYDEEDQEEELVIPYKFIDIDKSWQEIHFLLCGEPYGGELPLSNTILGGEGIGDDLGYGPARYLTAEEVKDVAKDLAGISMDGFKERFESQKELMKVVNLYPGVWEDDDEEYKYLSLYFEMLKDYYLDAEKNKKAMLLYVI